MRVLARDGGICAACGRDTHRWVLRRGSRRRRRNWPGIPPESFAGPWCDFEWRYRAVWELDHIIPLIDGGTHELANMQTLCVPCHRAKTKRETATRVERRRLAAEAVGGAVLEERSS